MNWLKTIIIFFKAVWQTCSLFSDIKKADPAFNLTFWMKHLHGAIKAYRKNDNASVRANELRAINMLFIEKCEKIRVSHL